MYTHAAVAADHAIASRAGVEILKAGGNAVDAAVAASFCLSVVRPYSCGIGGGGFMVIRLKSDPRHGEVKTALNYREVAIAKSTPDYYENDGDPNASTHGGRAVAVPGHVAGMLHALERYGTMTRGQVLAPAIRVAEEGFAVDAHYVTVNQETIEWLRAAAGRDARFAFVWDRFLKKGAIKVGDIVKLPEQARALRLIERHGASAFYEGEIAEAMVRAVRADRGEMEKRDLASYRVKEVAPFSCTFRGTTILTMPPPSSGGIVLAQVFGMLDRKLSEPGYRGLAANSAPYIHLVTEACKHAFADRARWLGDPDFVDVPTGRLLDPAYIGARADQIDPSRTIENDLYGTKPPEDEGVPGGPARGIPDDHGTSHLCVVDRFGGAVSCTETINLYFGSLVAVPEFGFCLNNEMDDFQARVGVENAFNLKHATRNRPAPGKRPLSSMTPIIALSADGREGDALLLAGASGGPRIISSTLQATLNVLLFDQSAEASLRAPRFHHQWQPDRLQLEVELMGGAVEASLKQLGHVTALNRSIGAVQLIRRRGGSWEAASDTRKGGVPDGY